MSLLVSVLELYTPELIKIKVLTQLFNATASAFGLELPPLAGLTSDECLATYARFVQAQAGQRLHDGNDAKELEQRLYQNAVEMGHMPNKWLGLHTMQDVMATARALYRILAIDLHGNADGEVVIPRCYFSDFYAAEVCRLMSAMDRGLFAGLSNGGELAFTSRITEGQPCCRAHFCLPNRRSDD